MRFAPTLRLGLIASALAGSLSGCLQAEATWFEERCLRYGFARGSADFDACVARDRAWIAEEQSRTRQPGGGGGP